MDKENRVFLVCCTEEVCRNGTRQMRIVKAFADRFSAKDWIADPTSQICFYHTEKHPKLTWSKEECAYYGRFADGATCEVRIISKEVE